MSKRSEKILAINKELGIDVGDWDGVGHEANAKHNLPIGTVYWDGNRGDLVFKTSSRGGAYREWSCVSDWNYIMESVLEPKICIQCRYPFAKEMFEGDAKACSWCAAIATKSNDHRHDILSWIKITGNDKVCYLIDNCAVYASVKHDSDGRLVAIMNDREKDARIKHLAAYVLVERGNAHENIKQGVTYRDYRAKGVTARNLKQRLLDIYNLIDDQLEGKVMGVENIETNYWDDETNRFKDDLVKLIKSAKAYKEKMG